LVANKNLSQALHALYKYFNPVRSRESRMLLQEKPLLYTYNLRRYRPSDLLQVKTVFRANIEEEGGVRLCYDGRYIDNAKIYMDSVVSDPDSDLNNIDETYFQKGTSGGVGVVDSFGC
jgi:hypothetical protein